MPMTKGDGSIRPRVTAPAFDRWVQWTDLIKRQRRLILRVADRWRKSYLVFAFEGGVESHAEICRRKNVVAVAMERANSTTPAAFACLNRRRSSDDKGSSPRQVARRWRDRLVVSAFVTWRRTRRDARVKRASVTRVTSRWRRRFVASRWAGGATGRTQPRTSKSAREKSRSKTASPAPRARVRPLVRLVPRHATRDAGGGARGGTVAERGARARVELPGGRSSPGSERRKALVAKAARRWRDTVVFARRVADERGGATTPPTPPGAGRRPVAPTRRWFLDNWFEEEARGRERRTMFDGEEDGSASGESATARALISGAPSAPSRRPRAACSRAGRRWASRSGRWLRGSFVGRHARAGSLRAGDLQGGGEDGDRGVRRAWEGWIDRIERRANALASLEAAIARWTRRALVASFRAWCSRCEDASSRRSGGGSVARWRWLHPGALRCFRRWTEFVAQRAALVTMLDRIAARWTRRHVAEAFDRWDEGGCELADDRLRCSKGSSPRWFQSLRLRSVRRVALGRASVRNRANDPGARHQPAPRASVVRDVAGGGGRREARAIVRRALARCQREAVGFLAKAFGAARGAPVGVSSTGSPTATASA